MGCPFFLLIIYERKTPMKFVKFLVLLAFLFALPVSAFAGGCIKGDCANGNGTYIYKNGKKYVGDWKDAKRHGHGELYRDNGTLQYEGQFKDGKKHEKGKSYHDNGMLGYDGEWKDGKWHGQGVLYNDNGKQMYEGEFKDGKPVK
jgi:hypothetical protein